MILVSKEIRHVGVLHRADKLIWKACSEVLGSFFLFRFPEPALRLLTSSAIIHLQNKTEKTVSELNWLLQYKKFIAYI